MSEALREMGLNEALYDIDEEQFEDDFDDFEEYPVEEEIPIDLLAMAKPETSKKQKAAHKNTGNKKAKKKNQATSKKNKIQVISAEEQEYYKRLQQPVLPTKMKAISDEPLEQVNFQINIKACAKMSFEQAKPAGAETVTYSSKWLNTKYLIVATMNHHEQTNSQLFKKINEDLIDANVCKELENAIVEPTSVIPKFSRASLGSYDALLKRSHAATAAYGADIWIHGGTDGVSVFADLMKFNTTTNQLTVYQDMHLLSKVTFEARHSMDKFLLQPLPATSGHKMVAYGETLLIFGGMFSPAKPIVFEGCEGLGRTKLQSPQPAEMLIYAVSRVSSENTLHLGNKSAMSFGKYNKYIHPNRSGTCATFIPKRRDFSATLVGGTIYVFGGRAENDTGLNHLYKLVFNGDTYICTEIKPPTRKAITLANLHWPRGRHGHSALATSTGNLIIFGGVSDGKFFSDIQLFNPTTNTWQEIDIDGAIPPPVAYHAAVLVNNQMLVYGGTNGQTLQSTMYTFSLEKKRWEILKVLGHKGEEAAPHGHQCVVVGSKMYKVGGVESTPNITYLSGLGDAGSPPLIDHLRGARKSNLLADTKVHVLDSATEEVIELQAHRAILCSRCPHLRNMIAEDVERQPTQKMIQVKITGYTAAVVDAYLNYLYTGSIKLSSKQEVKEFLALVEAWAPEKHLPVLKRICTGDALYMDTANQVWEDMQKDFTALLDDGLHSDVTLIAANLESVPAHRLILSKCEWFTSMLLSGMQESISGEVVLEYDKEVILSVLRYLYSDTISITPAACFGVLIWSTILGLQDLVFHCRNMIGALLTDEIVFQVVNVAETYGDLSLRRTAMNYIISKLDTLKHRSEFTALESKTRDEILESHYTKKQKQRKPVVVSQH